MLPDVNSSEFEVQLPRIVGGLLSQSKVFADILKQYATFDVEALYQLVTDTACSNCYEVFCTLVREHLDDFVQALMDWDEQVGNNTDLMERFKAFELLRQTDGKIVRIIPSRMKILNDLVREMRDYLPGRALKLKRVVSMEDDKKWLVYFC